VVGALLPGMVVTDMLAQQYEANPEGWERNKRVFNIMGDRVETIAPWFAQRMLANDRSGARIKWMSRFKLIGRFIAAPFSKRDLFEDQ
jgi:hypothetical protein